MDLFTVVIIITIIILIGLIAWVVWMNWLDRSTENTLGRHYDEYMGREAENKRHRYRDEEEDE